MLPGDPRRVHGVNYGKRLLPHLIDSTASDAPNRPVFRIPRTSVVPRGYREISFAELARGVNRLCWWIQRHVRPAEHLTTIAYIGAADIRYYFVLIAAMKCRVKVLLPSPTNNATTFKQVLEKSDCKAILFSPSNLVVSLWEQSSISKHQIPELEEILDSKPVEHFSFDQSFDEALKFPVAMFETVGPNDLFDPPAIEATDIKQSGLSSLEPETVTYTHAHLAFIDAVPALDHFMDHHPFFDLGESGSWVLQCVPPYHSTMINVVASIFRFVVSVFLPMHLRPTDMSPWLVKEALDHNPRVLRALMLPNLLERLAFDEQALTCIHRLNCIDYDGAPLSGTVGNVLSHSIRIRARHASTEGWFLTTHMTDWEDHQYICVSPQHTGIRWDEVYPGHFEPVFIRDDSIFPVQTVFQRYPDIEEYKTGDLFSKHPTKPHHWKYEGRKDDLIVLSIASSISPFPFEERVRAHPLIAEAVMLGQGREGPAMLVELVSGPIPAKAPFEVFRRARDDIWPWVLQANQQAPMVDWVPRERIIFVVADKRLPKAASGRILRKACEELYQPEMNAMYRYDDDFSGIDSFLTWPMIDYETELF